MDRPRVTESPLTGTQRPASTDRLAVSDPPGSYELGVHQKPPARGGGDAELEPILDKGARG